jgi:L-asparaginase
MTQTKQPNLKEGTHVVITGGTIDFHLNPVYEMETGAIDAIVPREKSIVPYFLEERVKIPSNEIIFSRACLKDSRDITDEDMARILDQIVNSPYKNILLTAGTAKMGKAREYLQAAKGQFEGKSVGLVGSHMPLSEYRSDAGFHLGYAFGQMQGSKPGVHSYHPEENADAARKILEDSVFFMTGGTIDSRFSDRMDTATPYRQSRIPEYFLEALNIRVPEPSLVFREVCMKDSRELTEEEIRRLLEESSNLNHKNQFISAGTYALPDIGGILLHKKKKENMNENKTILVGAMLPDDVHLNDGWFNVGYSFGKLGDLPNGTYLTMHGWATPPDNVLKQLHEARFKMYDPMLRV